MDPELENTIDNIKGVLLLVFSFVYSIVIIFACIWGSIRLFWEYSGILFGRY